MKPTEKQPENLPVTMQPPAGAPPVPVNSQPVASNPSTQTPQEVPASPNSAAATTAGANPDGSISWQASEFIDHQKSAGWYILLILGGALLSVAVYFLLKDILATVVTAVAIVTFALFARKKPRTLTYTLSPTYFKIGEKRYSYDDFRTFSMIEEGPLLSILLTPFRRFMPPLTIYFDPDDGQDIFDVLAERIPHEERQADPIDRFMRRIRF